MNTWTVRHYYTNPAHNQSITCHTRAEALAHLYGMAADSGNQCSYLEKNGVTVARRLWRNRRAEWKPYRTGRP